MYLWAWGRLAYNKKKVLTLFLNSLAALSKSDRTWSNHCWRPTHLSRINELQNKQCLFCIKTCAWGHWKLKFSTPSQRFNQCCTTFWPPPTQHETQHQAQLTRNASIMPIQYPGYQQKTPSDGLPSVLVFSRARNPTSPQQRCTQHLVQLIPQPLL